MADTTVSVILRGVDRMSAPFRAARTELGLLRSEFGRMGSVGARWGKFKHQLAESGAVDNVTKAYGKMGRETGALLGKLTLLGGAIGFVFKGFVETAAQFEMYQAQLEALEGSSEGAEKAMTWIEDFATRTPTDVAGVIEAFQRLKAFGLEPTDGTLQSLTDATAKLGFSQDKLMRISLAMGQAWGKQKLQGQEIMQLIEAGVPVWRLLEQATGKNQKQLQGMSEKGLITRKVMRQLIDEMGKDAAGASVRQMRTWEGIISNLGDVWTKFKRMVMSAGVFDSLKGSLEGLLGRIDEMSKNGQLKLWAEKVGAGMLGVAKAVPPVAKAIFGLGVGLAKLVEFVGGPVAALKILVALMSMKAVFATAAFASSVLKLAGVLEAAGLVELLGTATGAVVKFGLALFANPIGLTVLAVVALGAGIAALIVYWDDVVAAMKRAWEWFGRMGDVLKLSGAGSSWVERTQGGKHGFTGAPPPAPAPVPVPPAAKVEGQIGVKIDSEGRPSVRELVAKGGVGLDVSTGFSMRGGM